MLRLREFSGQAPSRRILLAILQHVTVMLHLGLSAQPKRHEAAGFVCAVAQFDNNRDKVTGSLYILALRLRVSELTVADDVQPTDWGRQLVLKEHPQSASGDFLCLLSFIMSIAERWRERVLAHANTKGHLVADGNRLGAALNWA